MSFSSSKKAETMRIGNDELERLTGGIPIPSLNLIEGENDTGKSVFIQAVAWGALSQGFTVRYITTEMTAASLVSQMESLSFHCMPFFINGNFRITAFHSKGINWDQDIASNYLAVMLNFIKKKGDADLIIFDSLTYIATHASENGLLNFVSELRNFVDSRNRVVFISIHPFAFDSHLLIRIRSICDGHVLFKVKTLPSNEMARSLEISKLRGATMGNNNLSVFKVEPAMGIRVLPFTQVKA
jgi:flagellar protein FlaH